jgi:linoleoyl-CoA desaturase
MHDANHGTLAKDKRVNFWFSKILYALGGFPPNWRQQHNVMHHKYTNVEGFDEDINPIGILRFSPHKPLKKIHKFQHIYAWFFYGLMTISWSTNKDFKQLYNYKKQGIVLDRRTNYRAMFLDLILSKTLYYIALLVIPIIFIPVAWYFVVLGYLLMHFVSGFSLGVIFQTAHVMPETDFPVPDDSGEIENLWAIHQLQTTSNYAPNNRFFSWLIGGLNFQVEHHLFPNINHIHYRKISKIVKEKAEKFSLPYHIQPSFFRAIVSHYKMLRSLGRA